MFNCILVSLVGKKEFSYFFKPPVLFWFFCFLYCCVSRKNISGSLQLVFSPALNMECFLGEFFVVVVDDD